MVVAEVPLWVVHSNANSPGSSKNPEPNNNSNNGTKNGKASESLLLLDGTSSSSSSSSAGLQKAAIYSIAVYGNRFATGGGDGTVRIWNAKALFPKPKSAITSRYKKPERVVSSDENEDIVMGNTLATNAANKTYESSGESSQDDESISPNSPDSQFNNNNNDNNDNDNNNKRHNSIRCLTILDPTFIYWREPNRLPKYHTARIEYTLLICQHKKMTNPFAMWPTVPIRYVFPRDPRDVLCQ